MRIRRVLAGVALPALGAAALWGLATAKPAPVRWGDDGHRMATRAAHAILPTEMPAFFREAGAQLEYLSPEPDRWRNGRLREMDEAWKYDHYIDLENVPAGALQAPDRFEFIAALYEAGIDRPQQTVGFLPFRILEMHQRLATGFAHWRLTPAGPDRDWIEARILNDAGILSHYAVDAAQPHHTTIHFNGWAEGAPNPKGFTADREFHSRFESGFVRAHLSYEDLPPRMPSSPATLSDVRGAIWEHLRSSNTTVERLYALEKAHGFDAAAPPHPDVREFAIQRLVAGAEMLASIWWTAWLESEAVADGLRARGWGR
jgi:hypothetical protein